MKLEEKVAQKLITAKRSLAVAESCTGGLLTHRLTNIAGSSAFFQGSLVVYSNAAKIKLLKVSSNTLSTYGAVSEQSAMAMSKSVRRVFNSQIGCSITGIAGPTGAHKGKPVGTTFIAVSNNIETICLQCRFRGPRESIKSQAATQALKLIELSLP